jgi:hypothetical protein
LLTGKKGFQIGFQHPRVTAGRFRRPQLPGLNIAGDSAGRNAQPVGNLGRGKKLACHASSCRIMGHY